MVSKHNNTAPDVVNEDNFIAKTWWTAMTTRWKTKMTTRWRKTTTKTFHPIISVDVSGYITGPLS